MLMRLITTLIAVLLAFISFAQETDLYQITPKWSIGEERIINSESETITYIADTVFSTVKANGKYKIVVLDTVDIYSIEYSQLSDDFNVDISTKNDSVSNLLMQLIQDITTKIAHLEYTVFVSKESGLAFEIKDSKELNEKIIKIISEFVSDLGKKKNKSPAEMSIVLVKNATKKMFETSTQVYKDGQAETGIGEMAIWGAKMSQLTFLAKGYMIHLHVKKSGDDTENREIAGKVAAHIIEKL